MAIKISDSRSFKMQPLRKNNWIFQFSAIPGNDEHQQEALAFVAKTCNAPAITYADTTVNRMNEQFIEPSLEEGFYRIYRYNSKEDTEKDPVIAPGKEKGDCRQYFFLVPEEAPALETTIDSTICESDLPFYWEEADLTFEEAGSQSHTFHTVFGGCDSIVTLNLNVLPSPEIVETRTICPEQLPYTWGEVVFTEAGTQTRNFERENACDSIVTYTIVVVPDLIQDGDTVCESRLSTPYTWEDETIAADDARFVVNEETGVKTLTIGPKVLPSSLVCDSTVQFTLTVIPEHRDDSYTICESELPFTWKAGEEEIVINTATDALNRSVTLPSVLGCDSTVHLNLTILPTARRGLGTVYIKTGNSFTVFEGTAYEQLFDTNGEYEVVGKELSAVGCDSVVTFTLEVRDTEIENIYDAICEGEPYVWNGIECTQTDVYEYKTTTIHTGLDSIAYLHLTVNPKYDQLTDGTAVCDSELPYTWEGETFTANDDYTDLDEQTRYREVTKNVHTKAGCDSIVTLYLTVVKKDTFEAEQELTFCDGDSAEYRGVWYKEAGEYTIAAPNVENTDLYLTYEGSIIWDLSMSAYPMELKKGNNEGYGLLLQAKMPMTPTGIEDVQGDNVQCTKVVIDEHVYILRGGEMYDVTGKAVK